MRCASFGACVLLVGAARGATHAVLMRLCVIPHVILCAPADVIGLLVIITVSWEFFGLQVNPIFILGVIIIIFALSGYYGPQLGQVRTASSA